MTKEEVEEIKGKCKKDGWEEYKGTYFYWNELKG
jgi:hypothetical protein